MTFDGQDLRGPVAGGDEPAARQAHRLHPAGADVQPRPLLPDRRAARPSRCATTSGSREAEARDAGAAAAGAGGHHDPERVFDSYPHQISGGMAQRVLIAGAVSCDPELLDRRRAHYRAGRHRAGRGARPDPRAAGGAWDGGRPGDPQLRRGRRPLRHGRGDAVRPDRGDRPGRPALRGPAARVHPDAARLDPGGRPPRAALVAAELRPRSPSRCPCPPREDPDDRRAHPPARRRAAAGRRPGGRRVPDQGLPPAARPGAARRLARRRGRRDGRSGR